MKRISSLFISVVFVVLGLFSPGFSERGMQIQENRFALVIGNGSYKNSPLRNPTNDARDMALVLKSSGFEVAHLENAEHRAMERAIRKFGKQLRNGGAGLFYYAGHGIQVNGRNYLIPVDAEIETESDVKFEAVDAGRVAGKMEDAGNDLNIVILDACRDNPFSRSFRASNQGLARMDAPKGSLIAYATAPGSIAADGEGRNGIYTKYLIKYIMTPGLTVELVLKKVRVEVLKETNNKQIPWESSSLTGNFYFNPVKTEMKLSRTKSQQPSQITQQEGYSEKYEMLFWDSIKESKDAESFKAYLNKFPNGVFAELAGMNIKKYPQQIGKKLTNEPNAERVKIKNDKPKLAAISKAETNSKFFLRKEPKRDLLESKIKDMMKNYNFFEASLNPNGEFYNDFIDNKNETVTDRATGLMWQKGGSKRMFSINSAKFYIKQLNKNKFAGYSDWRLPTIEELASLLKNSNTDDIYIDSVFDRRQKYCFSSDVAPNLHQGDLINQWVVSFDSGTFFRSVFLIKGHAYSRQFESKTDNYCKAVRSIK